MKNGMSDKKFHAICGRIASVYPAKKRVSETFRNYPRVVGHPLCKNLKCVNRNPTFSDLKKDVQIDEVYWRNMISKPCIFCAVFPAQGVDRISSSKNYTSTNLQPCCFQCNIMKKDIDNSKFIQKVKNIALTHGYDVKRSR